MELERENKRIDNRETGNVRKFELMFSVDNSSLFISTNLWILMSSLFFCIIDIVGEIL